MIRRLALYFIPPALMIAATAWYIDFNERSNRLDALLQQEKLLLSQQVDAVHQSFETVVADLIILSRDNDFHELAESSAQSIESSLRELAKEVEHFHNNNKPRYHSLYLFNKRGEQLLRTINKGGVASADIQKQPPSESQLADFKTIAATPAGTVHISPMRLHRQQDRIATPHEPLVRLSIPLLDDQQQRYGVLAIDYHAAFLIENLQRSSGLYPASELMLLNQDGFWLHHQRKDHRWGFLIKARKSMQMQHLYPALWQHVNQHFSGQFQDQHGIFTFSRVKPLASIKHRLGRDIPAELIYSVVPEQFAWTIINHIPRHKLAAMVQPNGTLHISVTAAIIVIWFIVALILAWERHQIELAHLQLREQEGQMRNIMETTFNGIITIDEHGIVQSFNAAACRIFQYEADEVIGNNISMLMGNPDREKHDGYLQRYIDSGEAHVIQKPREVMALHKDGSSFPIELCVNARQFDGHWIFVGVLHDITRRKAMEEELRALATTDGLTGVYNRAYFNTRLSKEFARAKRYKEPLSLLILDADHFKLVNDYYGHPAGDALLKALAGTIQSCAREIDTVARYGGEEFAVILPNTNGKNALLLADRIRSKVESMNVDYEGQNITRTVSIGVASLQDYEIGDEDDLLVQADQALYKAKNEGRNCVRANA